jgi:hypothetical protein
LQICRQSESTLYPTFTAKYSLHPPVYAMSTLVPVKSNAISVLHIQATIFNWTYLRCYWRYLDNSVRVILQTWCQIQRTSPDLRYMICGPGHIQCIYSSSYSGHNIQLNVSALILEISRKSMRVIMQIWCHILRTPSSLSYVNEWSRDIQCKYSSA